jgi:hypothetical protein
MKEKIIYILKSIHEILFFTIILFNCMVFIGLIVEWASQCIFTMITFFIMILFLVYLIFVNF